MRTICVFATLLVLCGCSPERESRQVEAEAMAETGAVAIVEPDAGDTVGSDVRVVLRARGVKVEPALGEKVVGSGHHHLFVDTDVTPDAEPIPKQADGIIHLGTGASEFTLTNLAPGEHRIIAVLAYGDHVPMEGVARDTVRVVVRP